ncbi:MAG: amino acid ABC transporter permease [Clostridioides sp.]|jgi:polar amino acid transport system permease protein|nr:amino acid ABC transporter permease [Clostridioides sp.]
MNFGVLPQYFPLFLKGIGVTVSISFVALLFGVIIGLVLCLGKLSVHKIFNILASIYIEVIRGTPVYVQIFIVFFALPQFGINFTEFQAAVFALSVNSGAYVAEIFRSGIQSIDSGQVEASRSLGLNYAQTMRFIIIPQALKNVLPTLANEFIALIKESAIVSVIGATDIMFSAMMVKNTTYDAFPPLILAAFIYFVLTFTLSKVVGLIEKKMSVSD